MSDLDVTFTQLSQLSRAYGAPAVNMAERIMVRGAAGQILSGFVFAAGALALGFTVYACAQSVKRRVGSYHDSDVVIGLGSAIGCVFALLGTIGCVVSAVGCLFDVWAWTALTDPQLALAHQIFGSMGGK